jgi:hypothetical protein
MNQTSMQQAMLVEFAVREAGPRASLEMMQAICYCIRNRVRGGWYDGSWLANIEHADEVRANEPPERVRLDEHDRNLQKMMQCVDDIWYGQRTEGQPHDGSLESSLAKAMHWAFLDRPLTVFGKELLSNQAQNPMRCQMGMMIFV